jgi:hypothetical protein
VTKANRRLSMAVCLVLGVKFNEPLGPKRCNIHQNQIDDISFRIEAVLDFADQQWSIPKKEVFLHL